MVFDGTFETVFHDGTVKTEDDLLRLLKSPYNYPCFGLVNGSIRALAWLNEHHGNYATAHFCVFKESWGQDARDIGKEVLSYWFSFPGTNGPLFDVILGVTPSEYKHVIRFIKSIGFTIVGEVPKILKGKNAVLSYCERKT